jgi:hypothetical protein
MPAAPVIRICIAFVPLRLKFTRSEAAPYEFEVIARDGSLQTIEGVRVFRGGDEALGVERRRPDIAPFRFPRRRSPKRAASLTELITFQPPISPRPPSGIRAVIAPS